jgi:hypothetical protein
MSKYLHTLDGKPATFDGFQICFASRFGKPNKLADSLKQIKKERAISIKNREERGYPINFKYGHLRYE